MLRQLASTVQYFERATAASDLPMHTMKLCSVLFVFGVVHAGCNKQDSLMRGGLRGKRTSTIGRSTVELLMALHQSSIRKPHIGRESRFLPTSPAFDVAVREGFPSEYCHNVWCGKTRMVCLPDGENVWRYVYSFWQNTWTWRTDRRTDRHRVTA